MENDIRERQAPFEPGDLKKISELCQFQIARTTAEKWANRDIKFLIYDDSDDAEEPQQPEEPPYDSDDEEAKEAYAIQLSLAQEGQQAEAEPSSSGSESECSVCSQCPEFPHDRKATKFRLYKPVNAIHICAHYVAVSYCWPVPARDADGNSIDIPRTYRVLDLDADTSRANRALDDVLDRAVDFANSCGLRMIWIDQECLPQATVESSQADKDEQQIGVQAMDIVYNRAIVTAGLHDSVDIVSQAQLDAVHAFKSVGRYGGSNIPIDTQTVNHVLDFLDMVNRDRWYTRAWVVQEALSAGKGLALVFRRRPNVLDSSGSKIRFADKFRTPSHSLDHRQRGLPSKLVFMSVEDFHALLSGARKLLGQDFVPLGQALMRGPGGPFDNLEGFERAAEILSVAAKLHPKETVTPIVPMHIYGGHMYGMRKRVDAAGALMLLSSRECRDQEDRIAIVANMCAYETRLDTRLVVERTKSLRLGLMALAVLNLDTSLFVPEIYGLPGSVSSLEHNPELGLMAPFATDGASINYCHVHVGNLIVPKFTRHTHDVTPVNGVRLPAYLWAIQKEPIDLTPVKLQWAERWQMLKCLRIATERQEGESLDAFDLRQQLVAKHFSRKGIMDLARQELLRDGHIAPASSVWDGIDKRGIQVEAYIDAARVRSDPVMQAIIAQVVFAIFWYLMGAAEDDIRAQGAANSIWQSLRVEGVRQDDNETPRMPELPDEVSEELFEHPHVVSRPFETLQLDETPDKRYAQLWVVDRVMRDGFLWVGEYQRCAATLLDPVSPDETTPEPEEEPDENSPLEEDDKSGVDEKPGKRAKGKSPARSSGLPRGGERGLGPNKYTIVRRQLQRQLLATMMSVDKPDNEAPAGLIGNSAWLVELLNRKFWSREADEWRANNLWSVFDVDGPCLVATPYNPEWEVLPRPALRSMSACWVAVALDQPNPELKASEQAPPRHEDKGKEVENNASGRSSSSEVGTAVQDESGRTEQTEKDTPRYRVLRKVMGLWEVMDPPLQLFVFC